MNEDRIRKYYEENPEGLPGTSEIPEIYEMHRLFETRVAALRPPVLLDAGCGKGFLGETLSAHCGQYHGIDISSTAVAIATERIPTGRFELGSLRALPYPSGFADCVVCSEVLEHVPDYSLAIAELARVVKQGKQILVSTPNKMNPDMLYRTWRKGKYTNQIFDKPVHYRRLFAEFRKNRLEIEEFFSFFYLPPFGESLPRLIRLPLMRVQEHLSRFIGKPLGLYLFFSLRK